MGTGWYKGINNSSQDSLKKQKQRKVGEGHY